MTEHPILVEERAGYRVITLNRPQRLNAFNEMMHVALQHALDAAEADTTCRALLLTGAGRAFCAGQDLSDRLANASSAPPDLGRTLGEFYNPLVRRLRALPMPIVCAVNGAAAGAGANLAFACDIVVAARSASFLQAFARIGLAPDCGGTWFLPRLVGEARARGLALLAEPISAEKAEQWGLIWQMVDDSALMEHAVALVEKLAAGPNGAYAAIKQALNASTDNDLSTQLDLERDIQRQLGRSSDYGEGVKAFMEKRRPQFGDRS